MLNNYLEELLNYDTKLNKYNEHLLNYKKNLIYKKKQQDLLNYKKKRMDLKICKEQLKDSVT